MARERRLEEERRAAKIVPAEEAGGVELMAPGFSSASQCHTQGDTNLHIRDTEAGRLVTEAAPLSHPVAVGGSEKAEKMESNI